MRREFASLNEEQEITNTKMLLLVIICTMGILTPLVIYLLMKKWNAHLKRDREANERLIIVIREELSKRNILATNFILQIKTLNEDMLKGSLRRPELMVFIAFALLNLPTLYLLYMLTRNIFLHEKLLNDFKKRLSLALEAIGISGMSIREKYEGRSPSSFLILGILFVILIPLVIVVFSFARMLVVIIQSEVTPSSLMDILLIPNTRVMLLYLCIAVISMLGYIVFWIRTYIKEYNKHIKQEEEWREKMYRVLK